jgi:apolipoprotein N-acyltransferase
MRISATIGAHGGKTLLAAAAGAGLTAAFPGIGAWYAAWGALALLLFAIRGAGPREGFLLGLLAGLVHYLSLLYWLAPTMQMYGGLAPGVSVAALILLSVYLSVYPALFSWMLTGICRRPAALAALAPVFWVGLEYARSRAFSGFPWALAGYSQYGRLDLIQIADVLGVYGVSGLIVLSNAVLCLLLLRLSGNRWQGAAITGRTAGAWLLLLAAAVGAALIYGGLRRGHLEQRMAEAETLEVAVVQGNIEQVLKWDKAFRSRSLEKYFTLSRRAKREHAPALIVWPETAAPFYFNYEADFREDLLETVAGITTSFLIGAPSVETGGERTVYFNSAYLVTPAGKVAGQYDKVHLVPFGEYVPFHRWLPFIETLVAQVGNFEAGTIGNTLSFRGTRIGMLICYESIFPRLSAEMTENGAGFLVNITNDAWFGKTAAPLQHFSMAVFRAVENRRALVRAANTGISGFIDPVGRIVRRSPLFEPAVLSEPVVRMEGLDTIYTRHGDFFAMGCLVATCALAVLYLFYYRKRSRDAAGIRMKNRQNRTESAKEGGAGP